MRSLLLIAAVLIAGALALEADQVCEPGSNFMMECNKCRCSADGKLMSCTRKFCVSEVQSDDPKAEPVASSAAEETSSTSGPVAEKPADEEQVHTNGQVCTPNDTKMEDCNRCKCAANGIGWFCTRKTCPQKREKRNALRASPPQCTPGTSFKSSDGCNDCFCTETGIAACTLRFCFNDKVKREAPKLEKQCEPGSSFKSADGCNDCFCTDNGIAACTMKFCFNPSTKVKRDAPKVAKQCEPGTSFKSADGCNDCFCTDNGIAACTMKFCFTDNKVKRHAPATSDCVKGSSFKSDDGCNTCFCGENGIVSCTKKFCVPKVKRAVQQQCVPGTTFKDAEGCNDCFCTADGRAACTEKLCLKPQKTKRAAPKVEKQCEPGSSFKSADGCNDCFCTETGKAACTLRACLTAGTKGKRVVDDLPQSKLAPGTEGFECAPNSRFKYQCNQCRCDQTGKHAACTYKYCVDGEW